MLLLHQQKMHGGTKTMTILNLFKKIFTNKKKHTKIICENLTKTHGNPDQLEILLTDTQGNLLPNKKITIDINGRKYEKTTNTNGQTKINIKLPPGKYPTIITFPEDETYNETTAGIMITIKENTHMQGTDITKNASETKQYQCAVYNTNNQRIQGNVDITINGVTYNRKIGSDGLAKLNIKLGEGTYTITSIFTGNELYNSSSVTNTVTVTPDPKPTPPQRCTNPYTSTPHPTASGCNGMGQNNSLCCGPSALHKILYKFGIRDITQNQLASWAGTGSGGTSHQGLETAIAKVNQIKGTNISFTWYNKSDLTWEEVGELLCRSNIGILTHILYKNGGTCDGNGNFGHYETLVKVNTATEYVKVINSLGSKCNNGCYCGYYQDRTMSCEELFMRGISQKSIAVLTME